MSSVSKSQVTMAMQMSSDKSSANDAATIQAMVEVLNATLSLAAGKGPPQADAIATAFAQKGIGISKIVESQTGSQAAQIANFSVGQFLKTMSLRDLADTTKFSSPGKVGAFVTVTVVEKVLMAGGLAGFNKCRTAVASLAATTAGAAIAAPTGVGAVIGAAAIASDLYGMYDACYANGKGGKDLEF